MPPDRPTDPTSTSILLADYEEKLAAAPRRGVRPRPARALQRARRRDARSRRRRRRLYEGEEPGAPVDEATQADFYRRAIELAACQENVAGLLLFHSHDEPALTGFQSGVYYVGRDAEVEPASPSRDAAERTICP